MRKVATEEKRKMGGKEEKKTDDYSGHYLIAGSQPPERQPLERLVSDSVAPMGDGLKRQEAHPEKHRRGHICE